MSTLTESQLPLTTEVTKVINSRQLQKMSGVKLKELSKGPQIIEINSIKSAVLVDYDQYRKFEKRFHQLVNKLAKFSNIFPALSLPDNVEIVKMRAEIEVTLREVAQEIPDTSPFTEYMDSMLALSSALAEASVHGPKNIKDAIMNRDVEDVMVEETSVRPTRNITK